jgi:hypothetical protein
MALERDRRFACVVRSYRRFIYDARESSSPFSDSQGFEIMKKIKMVPGRGTELCEFPQ